MEEELFIVEYAAGAGSEYILATSLQGAVDRINSLVYNGDVVSPFVRKVRVVAEYKINVELVPKKTP